MILMICGTHGSGKTTLVRRILSKLEPGGSQIFAGPKKVPVGVVYDNWLTVMGRYDENACGGCDAFSWRGAAYDLESTVKEEVQRGRRVLMEGVLVAMWGMDRLRRLNGFGLIQVQLDTPLEQCINSVNERRRVRAEQLRREFKPLDPSNTESKYRKFTRTLHKRQRLGIPVEVLDREAAYRFVCEKLGLPAEE